MIQYFYPLKKVKEGAFMPAKDVKNTPERKMMELRNYKVVKSNDLIQKSRFNLSLQEQKIILYLISKVKPEDTELKEYIFEIRDFCKICGLETDSGKNYKDIKQTLKSLRDKSIWITLEDGSETTLSWIDKITINDEALPNPPAKTLHFLRTSLYPCYEKPIQHPLI